MDTFLKVWAVTAVVWAVLRSFRYVYGVVGFFAKAKTFPPAEEDHTYAIVIAARNEERVIGHLLDSIALQDYDQSRLHVFVVADNCTDDTARICRERGATVYERHEPEKARKGWAMEFLFDRIERDFGIESFDAYLFFDADNLLARTFVSEINRAFDSCGDVVLGYRNTKNFDTNFISAGYGLHFLESILRYHRPRAFFNLSTHVAGCGYAVASRLLKDGWHWTGLTEDAQFYAEQVALGRHIEFCERAEFFDEQPYSLGVMVRQRLRWVKGRLVCFFQAAPKLFLGLFRCKKRKFSCLDIFFYITPGSILSALKLVGRALKFLVTATVAVGLPVALTVNLPAAIPGLLGAFALDWLRRAVKAAFISLRERRHIHCSTPKLILYTFLYPFFDLSGIPIAFACLFMRVQWKPIRHDEAIAITDLDTAAK